MISKRHSTRSRLRLGINFIIFVFGLLFFGWLWRSSTARIWRGDSDFSWIEQKQTDLIVHTISPEYAKEITWFIPGNTWVETAYDYGRYQWKSVFALAEIDRRGGEALMRTSQNALGLPINGWRVNQRTNLTWADELRWWYWSKLRVKRRSSFDLGSSPAWQERTENDGSQVFSVSEHRLDQLVNEETFSQTLGRESVAITLINGVRLARVLTNRGLELVTVANEPDLSDQTVIWIKDASLKTSRTVTWLKQLLPQAAVKIGVVEPYWTAIVLSVGKDYN